MDVRKLFWLDHVIKEEFMLNLDKLSPPSAEAIAKRNRKAKASIKRMGEKYLNVPFKKEPVLVETALPAGVARIKKVA